MSSLLGTLPIPIACKSRVHLQHLMIMIMSFACTDIALQGMIMQDLTVTTKLFPNNDTPSPNTNSSLFLALCSRLCTGLWVSCASAQVIGQI